MTPVELPAPLRKAIEDALGPQARLLWERFDGIGDRGAKTTGVTVDEQSSGVIHKTKLSFTNLVVAITDTGGASGGYGSKKLYDFPAGYIDVLMVRTNFSVVAAAGIGATAALKHSVGTAAEATNDTLDSTQANLVASTSTSLVGSAGAPKGISGAAPVPVDGTSAAATLNLNFGVADAGITATSSVTITGSVIVYWLGPVA